MQPMIGPRTSPDSTLDVLRQLRGDPTGSSPSQSGYSARVAQPAPSTAQRPLVSVIIPAYQAAEHLGLCLEALANQSAPATSYEVLVVDDASSDGTAALAHAQGARVLRHRSNGGAAAARNTGAAQARGDILLFLDSDLVPDSQIVDQVVALFATNENAGPLRVRCATGRYAVEPANDTAFARYKALWTWFSWERTASQSGESSHLQGALCAVERALFQQIGGFDIRYAGGSVEDYEISERLRAQGARIIFDDGIRGRHHFPGLATAAANYWDRARMYLRLNRGGRRFSSGQANRRSALAALAALGSVLAFAGSLLLALLASKSAAASSGLVLAFLFAYLLSAGPFLVFVLRERGLQTALYCACAHFLLSCVVGAAALSSPLGGGSERATACQPEAEVYPSPESGSVTEGLDHAQHPDGVPP